MAVLVRTEVFGSLFAMHTMDSHMGLLCTGAKQTRGEIESYLLCPTFGHNMLSNFVADMLGGTSSPSSRNLSGCFAVTTGQSERAAARIADTMLAALQTAVLSHFSKSGASEADERALEEAAELCADLCCIVILKGTVATEHVGDAVSFQAFCFGCESTPRSIASELKRLHNLSRGESFHVSEAGPVEGAAAQQAGGDQQGAVVDLVSDNEGEEEEREKNLISGDGSGAAGGIGASAPSLSRFESLRHSPGCTVAYARELTLVGGPFGCMAQFLCPAGVVTNDSVSNFEHNEWSEKCVEEAEKEIARGKQSAINGTGGGDLMEELCGGYYQEACDRVAKLWSDAWKYSKVSGGASEMMTVRPREVEGKIRGVDWVEEVRRGGARPHLVLASSVVAAIIERGLDDGAREGIGLLFGTPAGDAKSGGAGELRVLLCAVIERSEADSRCCSAAGPAIEDVRSRVFREHKLQMLGWYHTHPPNPDSMVALCPSLQDLQEQERFQRMTPDFVGLIASVSRDRNSFQAGVAAFVASRNQATRIRWEVRDEPYVSPAMCSERFVNIATALQEVRSSNMHTAQPQTRPCPKDTASSCRIGLASLQVHQQVLRAELAVAQLWRDLEATRARFSHKFSDRAVSAASSSKSGGGDKWGKRAKGEALPPLPGEREKAADVHCMCAHLLNARGVGQGGSRGSRGALDLFLRDEEEKELDDMPLPGLIAGSGGRRGERGEGGSGHAEAQSKVQEVQGRGERDKVEEGGEGSGEKKKRKITRGDGEVLGERSVSQTIIHMDDDNPDGADNAKANDHEGEEQASGMEGVSCEEPNGMLGVTYEEPNGIEGVTYDEVGVADQPREERKGKEEEEEEEEEIISSCPEVDGEGGKVAAVQPEDNIRGDESGIVVTSVLSEDFDPIQVATEALQEVDGEETFDDFQNRHSKNHDKCEQQESDPGPSSGFHVSSHNEWHVQADEEDVKAARKHEEEMEIKRKLLEKDEEMARSLQAEFNGDSSNAPSSSSKSLRSKRGKKAGDSSRSEAAISSSSNGDSSSSWLESAGKRSTLGRAAAKDGRDKLQFLHAESVVDDAEDEDDFEASPVNRRESVRSGGKKPRNQSRRDNDDIDDSDDDFQDSGKKRRPTLDMKNTSWRGKIKS